MARRKVEPQLPTGARVNAQSGRITLMITVEEGGTKRRLSQNRILPSEPRSYGNAAEACAGYARVIAYLEAEVDRAATVKGWWERWTNPDDKQWGAKKIKCPHRGPHSHRIYAKNTKAFVLEYGNRPIASIVDADIKRWAGHPNYMVSGMTALSTMFNDAARAGLRSSENPVTAYAKEAEAYLKQQRKDNRVDPPKLPVVERMLAHLRHPDYPPSLYGWFLVGIRTGARGAEIDGMQFEYVDQAKGTYRIDWQLHDTSGVRERPKHDSRRTVLADPEILAEIEAQRWTAETDDGWIWLNGRRMPWRHSSRREWWTKQVGGTSLAEICGGVTMYNATRHHWASWALNEGGMTPYQASILYGHSDGGKLLVDTYAHADNDAALEAARQANTTRPTRVDFTRKRAA
jgi:integrase